MRFFSFLFIILTFNISVFAEERFTNSDGKSNNKSLSEIIRWSSERNRPDPEYIEVKNRHDSKIFNTDEPYAFWIGHASFLVFNGDITILFDPIFSERASPFKLFGPKRLIKPAIEISNLPNIDLVVISHNHYDHLDIQSLKDLQNRFPDIVILIPKGDSQLLEKYNIKKAKEFLWWDNYKIKDSTITFTPAQHWSARGLADRNKSLWGSWYVSYMGRNIFHAGDTGYSNDFKEIRKRLGKVDFAMIPIGAYSPNWFMNYSHVTPEQAVEIAVDLNAKESVAMHWGTFILSDEPVLEPKERLKVAAKDKDINFYTTSPGALLRIK